MLSVGNFSYFLQKSFESFGLGLLLSLFLAGPSRGRSRSPRRGRRRGFANAKSIVVDHQEITVGVDGDAKGVNQ